jgi:hypothetical protein
MGNDAAIITIGDQCEMAFDVLRPLSEAQLSKKRVIMPEWLLLPAFELEPSRACTGEEVLKLMVENSVDLCAEV